MLIIQVNHSFVVSHIMVAMVNRVMTSLTSVVVTDFFAKSTTKFTTVEFLVKDHHPTKHPLFQMGVIEKEVFEGTGDFRY